MQCHVVAGWGNLHTPAAMDGLALAHTAVSVKGICGLRELTHVKSSTAKSRIHLWVFDENIVEHSLAVSQPAVYCII